MTSLNFRNTCKLIVTMYINYVCIGGIMCRVPYRNKTDIKRTLLSKSHSSLSEYPLITHSCWNCCTSVYPSPTPQRHNHCPSSIIHLPITAHHRPSSPITAHHCTIIDHHCPYHAVNTLLRVTIQRRAQVLSGTGSSVRVGMHIVEK